VRQETVAEGESVYSFGDLDSRGEFVHHVINQGFELSSVLGGRLGSGIDAYVVDRFNGAENDGIFGGIRDNGRCFLSISEGGRRLAEVAEGFYRAHGEGNDE